MLLVAEPCLGEEEKTALSEVVSSGWITMGDRVREFECAFADAHRAADAVAVTAAPPACIWRSRRSGSGRETRCWCRR